MKLLAKKVLVENHLSKKKCYLSAFSFVNIFLWQEHFDFSFEIIDDHLCIFAGNQFGTFLYLPPLGSNTTKEIINTCFDLMYERNKAGNVSRIENAGESYLSLCSGDGYTSHKKDYEYCYYREDLVALRGNDYKSKRASYNYFLKNNRYKYVPFESQMLDECLKLYDAWAQQKRVLCDDEIYIQMLDENHGVHMLAMQYFKELGLVGRVVFVDSKIKAYTFGYHVSNKVFCVLLEVADTGNKGLPVFIFREFCADKELKNFTFINVMDGFGMRGVERAKMSFRPVALLSSHVISKKESIE